MVVLHPYFGQGVPGRGMGRTHISGMEVMGQDGRLYIHDPLQMRQALLEKFKHPGVIQITDVGAQKCLITPGKTDRTLEPSPQGQNPGPLFSQFQRKGGIPPGAPDKPGSAPRMLDNGIIGPEEDVPVVKQKIVGNMAESVHGIPVLTGEGLPAPVAAGHDKNLRSPGKKQGMEGGVGQHYPQISVRSGNLRSWNIQPVQLLPSMGRPFPLFQKNNGPLVGKEKLFLLL